MAWWETDRVTERKRLIMEWLSGDFTVTELSHRHDISRDKAHKWIRRYRLFGPDGLEDRSHRPHSCPHATPDYVFDEAVRIRSSRRVPVGAGKVRARLFTEHPDWPVPSERTLHNHFKREGLVAQAPSEQAAAAPGPSHRALRRPELHLVGRLQRTVQDPRRDLLLSTHRSGRLQPISPRMPGSRWHTVP